MRSTPFALTGAAAAAAYQLDGFRDGVWPLRWCTPRSGSYRNDAIRLRRWDEPTVVNDTPVAPVIVVLRHLGEFPDDLSGQADRLDVETRVELAVEHALRDGLVRTSDLRRRGSTRPGEAVLHRIALRRGDEPPTESFAETRAAQLFRSFGWNVWRQVRVHGENGRILQRADFMVSFRVKQRRPDPVRPENGVLIEIDSREYHRDSFDSDYERQANYNRLGYEWAAVTPTQIEQRPDVVRRSIEGALRRAQTRRVRR